MTCTCTETDGLLFRPHNCPEHGNQVRRFIWPAFSYDDWSHDEMNGWVNPNDDPATPTETALLDEIAILRSELAVLRSDVVEVHLGDIDDGTWEITQ